MQTSFTPAQLADPATREADAILRKCVHCGFCTATCPTYVELGNELDSPRGRIYLIKDMLENDMPASAEVALHLDRCLSCLSCMTTCPSGVDYMHLIDTARVHVEQTYRRPLADRAVRALLAAVLPYPGRFRAALALARIARPLAPLFEALGAPGRRLGAMLRLAARTAPARSSSPDARRNGADPHPVADGTRPLPSPGEKRTRVALLAGCAQSAMDPGINAAAARLLARFGVEVVQVRGEGCCGAIVHHMGREEQGRALARHNIDAWTREIETSGLDAIVVTASGCGTSVKDYGHAFRRDPAYAEKAKRVSSLALDVTEFIATLDLPKALPAEPLTVAYHSACSMQHGQRLHLQPRLLLEKAGFAVKDIPEGHLCCGSAGTYNILQPEIARRLRDRKVRNIRSTAPDVIAAGNLGCITQIAGGTDIPICHTVELLDWAYGGPPPATLRQAANSRAARA